ncbi:MAG TPA: Gfo/Idh/MocA family oxidoreductase [Polyangiaceae bacterium]
MTIRWGIVGCGQVCEVKSGPALYKAPGSAISIVMRRDRARAEDFARRHGVRRFTDDAHEVIVDPDVDAVYVATPPGTHEHYALLVAAANKPCFVEKPMARSATECRRMVDAFRSVRRPLFVAYYRRALPRFVKLKELLDAGAIGEVFAIKHSFKKIAPPDCAELVLPWRLDAAEAGGGLFLDLGSHALDLFDFLLGPIERVTGYAQNHSGVAQVEDAVVAAMTFESGALGSVSYEFGAGTNEDALEVIGQRGQITCSVFGSEPLELCNESGSESLRVPHPAHVHQPLVETIVAELTDGSSRAPSRADSALRTSVIIDKILAEYYGGRDDAFWRRASTWPGLRRARALADGRFQKT